jgi:sugar phosphate isomerase/epimerase
MHDVFTAAGSPDYTAFGTGDVDHKQVLELLRGGGYEGYLSGEWINWEPAEVHLPREIATMRGYERALSEL